MAFDDGAHDREADAARAVLVERLAGDEHVEDARLVAVGDPDAALQALIFDSQFDQYRGVVSSVRVMNGRLASGSRLHFMQTGATHDALEIGARRPATTPLPELGPGEVGYLIAGIKDVGDARSGETITTAPVAGSRPRLASCVTPYLFAPSR